MVDISEKVRSAESLVWVGSGFVEIAALTALIGSSTTEHLTLGHRGAAGLPWAAISFFGTLSLVKTCLSACTPCWLQDTLGTQHAATDAALGYRLNIKGTEVQKSTYSSPVGLVYTPNAPTLWDSILKSLKKKEISSKDEQVQAVYRFDTDTANLLRHCPAAETKLPASQFMYLRDLHWRARSAMRSKRDWIVLLTSLSKIVEAGVLWFLGDKKLSILGIAPWLFFFVSALLLQVMKLSRGNSGGSDQTEFDVVAGELPSPLAAGGERKILFGVPQNIRTGVAWHLVWALGGLVCTVCLILTYVMLSRTAKLIVYAWLGFQLTWVALRSVVFYFAENITDLNGSVLSIPSQSKGPDNLSERTLRLITAVSRYQVLRHCRGVYCYQDDLQDVRAMTHLLRQPPLVENLNEVEDLGSGNANMEVEITAVIGDTIFSSMAWILGLPVRHEMDFFDSCLIEIKVGTSKVRIPATRVTSEIATGIPTDEEKPAGPIFVPRGVSNEGTNTQWIYWIPYAPDKWLEIATKNVHATAKATAILMTDDELTKRLGRGDLWISLKEASEIHAVVKLSRMATEHLVRLCKNL